MSLFKVDKHHCTEQVIMKSIMLALLWSVFNMKLILKCNQSKCSRLVFFFLSTLSSECNWSFDECSSSLFNIWLHGEIPPWHGKCYAVEGIRHSQPLAYGFHSYLFNKHNCFAFSGKLYMGFSIEQRKSQQVPFPTLGEPYFLPRDLFCVLRDTDEKVCTILIYYLQPTLNVLTLLR